jgi:hypothetical protein
MKIDEQLAAIGFAGGTIINCDWRTVRLAQPAVAEPLRQAAAEPACSRTLLRWRDRLRRRSSPSPYRISRA